MAATCTPNPDAKETMNLLLSKDHSEYNITYKCYLANHLAHGICSLYSLGASKERLIEYYEFYSKTLEPLKEPQFEINDRNWQSHIGNQSAYAEYLKFFDQQVEKHGQLYCVETYLPRLIPGLISGALHPLIHIGYGIEYENAHVLAQGLAYASSWYLKAGDIIDTLGEDVVRSFAKFDLASELKDLDLKQRTEKRQAIDLDLKDIINTNENEIKALLRKWQLDEEFIRPSDLDMLTKVTMDVCFGSCRQNKLDFYLAHALTGNHAVRMILPCLPSHQQRRLLRMNALALIGIFIREGAPTFNEEVIRKFKSRLSGMVDVKWPDMIQKAIQCNEEHVAKVVRALLFVRKTVPVRLIPHAFLDNCAFMIVNTVRDRTDWVFSGIGFLPADED